MNDPAWYHAPMLATAHLGRGGFTAVGAGCLLWAESAKLAEDSGNVPMWFLALGSAGSLLLSAYQQYRSVSDKILMGKLEAEKEVGRLRAGHDAEEIARLKVERDQECERRLAMAVRLDATLKSNDRLLDMLQEREREMTAMVIRKLEERGYLAPAADPKEGPCP